RAVLVVEAIARAIRRSDVELNKVNVLAEDVGRSSHLKIIDKVIVRYQIGVPVLDDVARVAAEEQRFRLTAASAVERERRRYVVPQRKHALLRVVPSLLVENNVELKCCRLVGSLRPDWLAVVVDRRIGERRSRLRSARQAVEQEPGRRLIQSALRILAWRRRALAGRAIREESRIAPLAKEGHRRLLHVGSDLRQLHRLHGCEVLAPIERFVTTVPDRSTGHHVSRHAPVQESTRSVRREIERRVRRPRSGNPRYEVRESGIQNLIPRRRLKLSGQGHSIELAVQYRPVKLRSVGATADDVETIDLVRLTGPADHHLPSEGCRNPVDRRAVLDLCVSRKRRHRYRGHRDNGGSGTAALNLAIRKRARSGHHLTVWKDKRSRLERVVGAPHRPHSRSKVRIEVTVEYRVSYYLVAISAAVVNHLQ